MSCEHQEDPWPALARAGRGERWSTLEEMDAESDDVGDVEEAVGIAVERGEATGRVGCGGLRLIEEAKCDRDHIGYVQEPILIRVPASKLAWIPEHEVEADEIALPIRVEVEDTSQRIRNGPPHQRLGLCDTLEMKLDPIRACRNDFAEFAKTVHEYDEDALLKEVIENCRDMIDEIRSHVKKIRQ